MNFYNETKSIKHFFKHISTKDKKMKIINKGYHELYMDREKETVFEILMSWLKEHNVDWQNHKPVVFPKKFRTHFHKNKRSRLWKILAVVLVYLALVFMLFYQFQEQQEVGRPFFEIAFVAVFSFDEIDCGFVYGF